MTKEKGESKNNSERTNLRIRSNVLREYLRGAGSIFDIFGVLPQHPILEKYKANLFKDADIKDREALASDLEKIDKDMRSAIKKFNKKDARNINRSNGKLKD